MQSNQRPEVYHLVRIEFDNHLKGKIIIESSFAGYIFLITTVILAFAAFYFVVRNPERREILQNIIRFRSTSSRVRYARVSICRHRRH